MQENSQTTNSTISPQKAALELLKRKKARETFTEFCAYIEPEEPPAAHHKVLCDALERIVETIEGTVEPGQAIRNLMVFMPPGSAKSTYSSVRFPIYFLGRLKSHPIISGSYSADLSKSFGRKVRNKISSPEVQNLFPGLELTEDQRSKGEWETKEGGSYYACGVDGSVTGRRAMLGLIDDPVKGRKEADSDTVKLATWQWYNTDFLTRLKPNGAQVIIQTRWADDDLSGRILPEDWAGESGVFTGRDGKTWHVINIQAQAEDGLNDPLCRDSGDWLWTDYFNTAFWEETKLSQQKADARNWTALYQGKPTPEQGTYFQREWFKRYPLGEHPKYSVYFGASDYAVSEGEGDFTEQGACCLCPEGNLYLVDWISGQDESDVWVDDLLDLTKKWNPLIWGAEVGQIKKAVSPWLNKRARKRNIYPNVEPMSHVGDKAANARSFQAMCKLGMVYVPICDWGDEVIRQLVKFPGGAFDDKVDTCGLMGRLVDKVWEISPPDKKTEEPAQNDYSFGQQNVDDWRTV